ncbi:amino acid ABC transporter permease [Pseudomonas sp. NPDC089422]|uniref:amino acid ABC transporter permease n=1 Tax=Pseudomonas sp. NPDC089422 TaxID=3364466 RepID=UPI0038178FB0
MEPTKKSRKNGLKKIFAVSNNTITTNCFLDTSRGSGMSSDAKVYSTTLRAYKVNKSLLKGVAAVSITALVLVLMETILALFPHPIGANAKDLSDAVWTTVTLTITAGVFGTVVGTVAALGKVSTIAPVRWVFSFYIWVARGTPLLLQILFVFFALPVLIPGLEFSDFTSAAVALAFNIGAYNAEAIRSGLLSVPKGQIEAAHALGLSRLTIFNSVVMPQALRICLPPLVNNGVSLLKDSSLAYAIGVVELSNAASRIQSATFEPVPVLITSAIIYLTLTTGLTQVTNALERYLSVDKR